MIFKDHSLIVNKVVSNRIFIHNKIINQNNIILNKFKKKNRTKF
jgi:hypothetical protein